jgi:uncharacterized protein YndB with AHSA1/START domain
MAPTIEREILIDAPVDVVWRAVTEPEQVRRWFADEVDMEAKAGYEGSLTFNDKATNRSLSFQVTVQSVQPVRSLSYRWLHPQGAAAVEGNSTLVEFTLTPEGDGTRLHVVESGLERMGWPQEQQDTFVDEHTHGWVTYLAHLRELVERQRADQAP